MPKKKRTSAKNRTFTHKKDADKWVRNKRKQGYRAHYIKDTEGIPHYYYCFAKGKGKGK